MTRLVLVVIVALAAPWTSRAIVGEAEAVAEGVVDGDALVAAARSAFDDRRWEDALTPLARLLDVGGVSRGLVLADMAACAQRQGRPAEAVLFARRALLHLPRDGGLRAGLSLAHGRLGLDLDLARDETFASSLHDALSLLTPREQLLLVGVLQTTGLLLIVLRRRSPVARRIGVVLVALALLGAARLAWDALDPPPTEGVVLTTRAELRGEPRAEAPATSTLRAGDEVFVTDTRDEWLAVQHARGNGWIEAHAVGLVVE